MAVTSKKRHSASKSEPTRKATDAAPTRDEIVAGYRDRENRLIELAREAARNIYEIAEEVWALVNDNQYLDAVYDSKPDARDERLAEFVGVTGFGINDLVQMFNHFPKRESWETGRLDILRDETCRLINQQAKKARGQREESRKSDNVSGEIAASATPEAVQQSNPGRSNRSPVAFSKYAAAINEIGELKIQAEEKDGEYKKAKRENERVHELRAEVDRLRDELEQVTSERDELQRQLDEILATVGRSSRRELQEA